MDAKQTPSVLLRWEGFLEELFVRTSNFPRRVRFSLTHRIENAGLEVYEWLVEAQYTRRPIPILHKVNLRLEQLRLLLRLCYRGRFLPEAGLRVLVEQVDEVGRMVGGWLRSEKGAIS